MVLGLRRRLEKRDFIAVVLVPPHKWEFFEKGVIWRED
jgi:hypothetical protein